MSNVLIKDVQMFQKHGRRKTILVGGAGEAL